MPLPTQGFDAHGHKIALEPKTGIVPAVEFQYVPDYRGYSYNSYHVQYLGEFWPAAEAVAKVVDGGSNYGAHWSTNPSADGIRVLTVHTD